MIAATYGYVYVAQVAMGADKNQFLKAILEAEKYNGPSLIIAYAPCINHGIRQGMGRTQARSKQAVDAGYWHLWRYNPELKEQGKNPFILDSKEPSEDFQEFLDGEVRYTSLKRAFPDIADELYAKAKKDAEERYENYANGRVIYAKTPDHNWPGVFKYDVSARIALCRVFRPDYQFSF